MGHDGRFPRLNKVGLLMKWNLDKYVELTKPRVTLLNLFVGVTCFILASYPELDLQALFLFSVAGYLAAGGCGVLNCVYDANVDKLMQRTSSRAIPAGFITSRKALVLGLVMTSVGILVTFFVFKFLTALMVLLGAVFYVLFYTILLKRISSWNVIVGGLAGCFAALSGWIAAVGSLSLLPLLISLVDFLWTPGHLWGLAIKKVREYGSAGIPMLPVTAGLEKASKITVALNVLTIVSSLLLPILGVTGFFYSAVAFPVGTWFLFENRPLARSPSESRGQRVFFCSIPYLAFIMIGLISDKILL